MMPRTQCCRLPRQRIDESLGLERLGAQLKDQRPHLRQPCLRQRQHVIERLDEPSFQIDLGRILIEQFPRSLRTQLDAV